MGEADLRCLWGWETNVASEANEECLENFRAAMIGLMKGALELGAVTDEGAATLYMGAVTAAREVFLGEDSEEALMDEMSRWHTESPRAHWN